MKFGQESWDIFDDQLTVKDHIATTARSCKFALYSMREIRPFRTEHATNSRLGPCHFRLDYYNSHLAGFQTCAIKPHQMIQNGAARVVFNVTKRDHVTPLFISLHWLQLTSVSSCSSFQVQVIGASLQDGHGLPTSYLHSLLRVYMPSGT